MPLPFTPNTGFGMNVACRPLRLRHVLHHEAERADVVGGDQRVVVAEIDLVLAGRDLVVRGLDVKAHLLERQDDLAADVLAEIDRRQIEVAARVVRLGRRLAGRRGAETGRTRPPGRPSS